MQAVCIWEHWCGTAPGRETSQESGGTKLITACFCVVARSADRGQVPVKCTNRLLSCLSVKEALED